MPEPEPVAAQAEAPVEDLPSESLFEVPDGFWDEPADPPWETPGHSEPVPAMSETQPAPEAAGGLALVQELFPGRVVAVTDQPERKADPAEAPVEDDLLLDGVIDDAAYIDHD